MIKNMVDPFPQQKEYFYQMLQQIKNLIEFNQLNLQNSFKTLPSNPKKVFFSLEDDRLFRDNDGSGRYAYLTLNAFSRAGYSVYFYRKSDWKGFRKLRKYGRFI